MRSADRARAAAKRLANAKERYGVFSTAQLLCQCNVAPTTLRAYETGVRVRIVCSDSLMEITVGFRG